MKIAARLVVLCLAVFLNCGFALVTQQELNKIRSGQPQAARDVSNLYITKVVPFAKAHAHPLEEVLKSLSGDSDFSATCKKYGIQQSQAFPCTFWVSFEGIVATVDRKSRTGKLKLKIANGEKVTVLLGPVIPGNGVRNGYPEISYNDFDNQSEFADFGDALNEQVVQTVKPVSKKLKPGQKLKVTGAYSTWGGPMTETVSVTPVAIEIP